MVRPSHEGKRSVLDWLNRSGVTITKDTGEWVYFATTVEQANAMLGTQFRRYRHLDDPAVERIRTMKVMVPENVFRHLKLVHPTTRFAQIKPQRSIIFSSRIAEAPEVAPDASCNRTITPACLSELYSIKDAGIDASKDTGIVGIAGFLTQYARFKDLAEFLDNTPSAAKEGANFSWTSIHGEISRTIVFLNTFNLNQVESWIKTTEAAPARPTSTFSMRCP
jgi:tripeptidyl-peptidase-1